MRTTSPFRRPVPDATQGDQIEYVANCASPVFKHLEQLGAQGEVSYQDDTPARILAWIAEHQEAAVQAQDNAGPPPRTGRYTTGLTVQVEGRRSCL